ncbi:MAG: hypothetical protein OXG49_15375 [Chloroflexi bacterium]|nr:hypothetical protein [Chloroflexota bacterium]
MRSLIHHRWRRDRLPLLLYLVAFIVMTHPLVFHMHDSLPIHNSDTYKALWQNWWMREALVRGLDVHFSDFEFHPIGVDLSLEARRWTTFPLWTAFYTVFDDPLAFNLVSLVGILFKAYGMYLVGLLHFRARIPAWVTGGFYALAAPALMLALRQPNSGATEWIPWLVLVLAYGLERLRAGTEFRRTGNIMLLAGLIFSLNVYMHLRIAIFAMLIAGAYLLWSAVAYRLWARRRFWLAVGLFAASATISSAPLLLIALNSEQFAFAIDRPVERGAEGAIDLLNLVKADHDWPLNAKQVIASLSGDQLEVGCLCKGMSQVGIVGLAFALMGAVYIVRFRRDQAVWIVMAVFSLLLSFGVVFYVDGKALDIYWTPYRLLEGNFFIRALWHPFRMVIVFLFPFSILVGYGLQSRLRTVKLDRRGMIMMVVSVVALLYGTSIFPLSMQKFSRPAYVSALADLPAGAVIDLPMGHFPAKYYMALQRYHGRPMVEGMLPRTPPQAYDYIDANPVLLGLRNLSRNRSAPGLTEAEWRAAVADLERDGFRYLILHKLVPRAVSRVVRLPKSIEELFISSVPVYKDDYGSVYDLTMWNGPFTLDGREGFHELPDGDRVAIHAGENLIMRQWSLIGAADVTRCQWVSIESWWETVEADPLSYGLTLILADEDGNSQVAIGEKAPADLPTNEWRAGVYYRDRTSVFIPCNIESGKYLLLLGMKDIVHGPSLALKYADGSAIGTLYYLTTLNVSAD